MYSLHDIPCSHHKYPFNFSHWAILRVFICRKAVLFAGCKVLVASRKIDQHQATIDKMKSLLKDPEQLQITQCNIRKEEEVV